MCLQDNRYKIRQLYIKQTHTNQTRFSNDLYKFISLDLSVSEDVYNGYQLFPRISFSFAKLWF